MEITAELIKLSAASSRGEALPVEHAFNLYRKDIR